MEAFTHIIVNCCKEVRVVRMSVMNDTRGVRISPLPKLKSSTIAFMCRTDFTLPSLRRLTSEDKHSAGEIWRGEKPFKG